ncbi:MAG: DSBA oxidoreductase [Alphaproteobacteria bacterium]|nr:MAG: DSBA oxidoreductase [Alphaproteobacteria bacterium]
MTTEPAISVDIDVVSDVMCPWCFVGKRHLEMAVAGLDGIAANIRWRPFQLDPTLPAGGKDRKRYLEDKFGSLERIRPAHDRLVRLGREVGIAFDFDAIAVAPNTLDAHRLIRWAGGVGAEVQDRVVTRLFELYFVEGADVGDRDLLAAIAEDAGMDRALVCELLAGDDDRETVRQEIAAAQRMGVTGVPCFIIDRRYAVMGAQPPEVLAQAIGQAAAARREDAGHAAG